MKVPQRHPSTFCSAPWAPPGWQYVEIAPEIISAGSPLQLAQPGYVQWCWYEIVRQMAGAIAEAGFDLIWLPPPSWAGACSAG